jgi:hypothetical protein
MTWRNSVESKIAAFPSVVAAKRAAVTQLSYYRAMMGTEQEAASSTSMHVKFARPAKGKAAASLQKSPKK